MRVNMWNCNEDGHVFDDHPTICSECGEPVDRAELIDFMEDSD